MKGERTYEDFEDLGQKLIAAQRALGELQSKLMWMFLAEDERGRPLPTSYDRDLLERTVSLARLRSQLALEYRTEAPEVPEGKPEIPPPFDREDR